MDEANDVPVRIAWHPGFASALKLEFRSDEDVLTYETEHGLNQEPLRIDLLVIKKDATSSMQMRRTAFTRRSTSCSSPRSTSR